MRCSLHLWKVVGMKQTLCNFRRLKWIRHGRFPPMLLPAAYVAGPAAVVVFHEFLLSIKISYVFPFYLWPIRILKSTWKALFKELVMPFMGSRLVFWGARLGIHAGSKNPKAYSYNFEYTSFIKLYIIHLLMQTHSETTCNTSEGCRTKSVNFSFHKRVRQS